MGITLKIDTREFEANLRAYADTVHKDTDEAVRDEMRLLVQRCIELTPPFTGKGKGMDAKRQGEAAVTKDIQRLFRAIDTLANGIRDERIRVRVKALIRRNDANALSIILKNMQKRPLAIAVEASIEAHTAARDRRGRVRKNTPYYIILRLASVTRLITEKMAHVGKAKAGWNAAAHAFRVASPSSWPGWVRRHGTSTGQSAERKTQVGIVCTAINADRAIDGIEGDVGILAQAFATRERDLKTKLKNALERASRKYRSRL